MAKSIFKALNLCKKNILVKEFTTSVHDIELADE